VQAGFVRFVTASLAAGLLAALLPAATAAEPSAAELRRQQEALAASSRSALLELYALEGALAQARTRLASVQARADAVEREHRAALRRLGIARTTLRRAELLLGARLRALYEQGNVDPLAVVLGADSVDAALDGLDSLRFAAGQDAAMAEQARKARARQTVLATRLAARSAELRRLRSAAESRAAGLEQAVAEREAYLVAVARQQRLNAAELASLERQAAAARARSQDVTASATAAPAQPVAAPAPAERAQPPATRAGRTLTVLTTGYALRGRTSSGMPVAYGVAAVDPAVIPLGSRFTVPGYGVAVAADTGSAIRGARVDLWFPSPAHALAWGSRVVTISLD
jgi:3D (Asp-Asp-Asp) domain-containing protein